MLIDATHDNIHVQIITEDLSEGAHTTTSIIPLLNFQAYNFVCAVGYLV